MQGGSPISEVSKGLKVTVYPGRDDQWQIATEGQPFQAPTTLASFR